MGSDVELEGRYAEHQSLRRQLPNAWNAFFARFGTLRPVQLAAAPRVLAGRNLLITAPTAGGKSEAVAAPLCERIVGRRWPGLSVLLVTPTRALVNDLFRRLEQPCEQMRVRVGRKTGDHAMSALGDDQLLITTPESLESLLTFRRHALDNLRAVVIDEIHLLDGTPRGDQLRVVLRRLSAYLNAAPATGLAGLQTLAMSATVPDPRRLADVYLGTNSEVVAVPGQRELDARVVPADGPLAARVAAAVQATEAFPDVRKVLVFFNSRREVDEGTGFFRQGAFERVPAFGHHGSLSKHQRELAEARFKGEGRAICVATMTLEVGIDIGDIDLVVCMDPPFSVTSFLQRIGRGCRRLAGRTRVLCVARDGASEILFHSMVRQAGLGLPVGPLKPFRASVLVQQALAYLKQVDKHSRTLEQFVGVFASAARPPVSEERVRVLLADLVAQQLLDVRGRVFQPASLGWEFIESNRIYSNLAPTPIETAIVDADTGHAIANVAAIEGQYVRVAGRSYEVLRGSTPGERKVRAVAGEGGSPLYRASRLPYAADVGAAVAGYLGIGPETLAIVPVGSRVVVFTWLGKLLNAALSEALTGRGLACKPGAFALATDYTTPAGTLELISSAVATLLERNPLGGMKVERMVDVGPHFDRLSVAAREHARRDWLDIDHLVQWREGLRLVEVVAPDTDLASKLLQLP